VPADHDIKSLATSDVFSSRVYRQRIFIIDSVTVDVSGNVFISVLVVLCAMRSAASMFFVHSFRHSHLRDAWTEVPTSSVFDAQLFIVQTFGVYSARKCYYPIHI
jgi:hypothetical protein